MDLRERNEQFLKKHIRRKYPREDLFEDMYNEAWVFLGEIMDKEELAEGARSLVGLDERLEDYGKDVYGTALLGKTDAVPLDSAVRYIGGARLPPAAADEVWESEATSYEHSKEELRRLLPPLEYEALEALTQNKDEQRSALTSGFTPRGLQMLLRRALIRKAWAKQS